MRPDKTRSGLWSLLCAVIVLTALTDTASAQDPRRGYGVGVAGQGTDMWTQAMSGLRLFTPHRDNCITASEVFVKVYTNTNSVDFGFCMDKNEHSAGNKEWEDARVECLEDGKRLPEVGEWKYACQSVSGLNNMTDDSEWGSNFWTVMQSTTDNKVGNYVPVLGNGNCKFGSRSAINRTDSVSSSMAFRCVR